METNDPEIQAVLDKHGIQDAAALDDKLTQRIKLPIAIPVRDPQRFSDIQPERIKSSRKLEGGRISVVTHDGQKYNVIDDSKGRK